MNEAEVKAIVDTMADKTNTELEVLIFAAASELFDRELKSVNEIKAKAAAAIGTEDYGKLCAAAGKAAGEFCRRWEHHGTFYDVVGMWATGHGTKERP